MKTNIYPVKFKDFLKIIEVGNYPIMYSIQEDYFYIEMPIENCIFASKKFFDSIKSEMQYNISHTRTDMIRYFIRTYLKTKNYYQFYPSREELESIKEMKLYQNLVVSEKEEVEDYDNSYVTMKEDDINVFLYHLDKQIYKMEKS